LGRGTWGEADHDKRITRAAAHALAQSDGRAESGNAEIVRRGGNAADMLGKNLPGRGRPDGEGAYFRAQGLGGREDAMKEKIEAISGTVTGNDQHVGFRAMIMKQAIEYNLAGFAKNLPNDVVNFTLQGDAKRLTDAVSAIQEGTKRSSDIKVSTTQGKVDPALNAFTIYAWTSTTRNITNPYDLVFHLRPDDGKLTLTDVKTVWHGILRSTLKGDDLKKLGSDD
jgi:acylphosphatase